MGLERLVLSRELTFNLIKALKSNEGLAKGR